MPFVPFFFRALRSSIRALVAKRPSAVAAHRARRPPRAPRLSTRCAEETACVGLSAPGRCSTARRSWGSVLRRVLSSRRRGRGGGRRSSPRPRAPARPVPGAAPRHLLRQRRRKASVHECASARARGPPCRAPALSSLMASVTHRRCGAVLRLHPI
ncbi:unnamed protein product [Prorocentrum cordatum]|uniref:Uncharacterized protein n=1 Tax=Prorocentrum cordatum TaxID=2364126 RepID=A0ABN9QZ06_9DINO|nr:unnamed protein product [Polarella glacialis]